MADDVEAFDDPIVRRMLRNFKLSSEAESENRKRGLKALKFRRGGKDQWDTKVYELFGQQNKPRDSYNQIPQFVHQVTNDMRMNMPQIRFAAGDGGDDEGAEVREDLARAIQSTTEAEVAYDAAADSQVTIGWGYWRFITKYANAKTKDKDIAVQWCPNPFQIYDDPNAMMQDFSDRKFLIHVEDMPVDGFNEDYDRKYDSDKLQSIGDSAPDWATKDTVRVAEYWEVKTNKRTVYFDDGGKLTDTKTEDSREIEDPVVMWYKCTGAEVLDSRKWDGIYIPYVRVSGETLYIDGKVLYLGLVDGMMAVQTQFNYFSNTATFLQSLAPIAPFMVDPKQIEGYQPYWDKLNIEPYPYAPFNRFDDQGRDYGVPQRSSNAVDLNNCMTLLEQAQQNFYNVTGIYPASLGQESNEKSGKAILARQKEGDVSTFHFPDNMARALRCGGRILEDLMPKTYDGSRVIGLLREDKSSYQATINQEHDDNGIKKFIDMTKGEYQVSVTTGPSYSTRKAEAADQAQQIIQSFPQIMQTAAGPELVKAMDLVNADMIAEALERSLPPQLQTPPDLKKLPPQVQQLAQRAQAQIQQLEQQLQQAQQIIQQGGQEMQTLQSQLQNKQADSAAKIADSQAKQADAQRKAQVDAVKLQQDSAKMAQDLAFKRADVALQARALDIQAFSAGMGADQQQMAAEMQVIDTAMGQSHAAYMQAADHAHQISMANNDAANQAILAAHTASLQPLDNSENQAETDNSSGA